VWLLSGLLVMVALLSPWAFGSVALPGGAHAARWSAQNLQLSLLPPSWMSDAASVARVQAAEAAGQYVPGRLLGTDRIGRDVLARVVAGSAISLTLGIAAAFFSRSVGGA
jgi:peptide/nickel transport system permease protein